MFCLEITFDEDLSYAETIQFIFISMHLLGFNMVQGIIEGNFWTLCGLVIVTLFAFFCFWLIDLMTMVFFFVLNLLFDYYSGLQIHLAPKMRFNLVQYHGTVGDFNYCKFTNLPISCSIKKYLNLNLLRLVSLQIIIIIMFHFIAGVAFMLLIVFYLLKLKMSKRG